MEYITNIFTKKQKEDTSDLAKLLCYSFN